MSNLPYCDYQARHRKRLFVSFAPLLLVSSANVSRILPRKRSCHTLRSFKTASRTHHAYFMQTEPEKGKSLPEFDRDYYDELKAEFGHLDGVSIFSRNDYKLDPLDTPWLFDDRARDLEQIREDLSRSPITDGELEGLPNRSMRATDMNTEQEINEFESRLRECDATNGKMWEDPMPESDFDGDPRWIHLRKVDDKVLKAVQEEPELWFEGMEKPALKRKQYRSEEEEVAALMNSFDRMQADQLDIPFEAAAYGERTTIPEPSEFKNWQREAEARGGNATKYESYFLSPFSSWNPEKGIDRGNDDSAEVPPKQHQTLVSVHSGRWDGHVSVISVCNGETFAPKLLERFPSSSDVTQLPDGSLEWMTTVEAQSGEVVSLVSFSNPDCKDALIPGRAVSQDGCYICKGGCTSQSPVSACALSMSASAVKRITLDEHCRPIMEISLTTGLGDGMHRHRVLFCAGSGTKTGNCDKPPGRITMLVVFTEVYRAITTPSESNKLFENSQGVSLPLTSAHRLVGTWSGRALLLQPEYPPRSCLSLQTSQHVEFRTTITEDDVTFVENMIPEHPNRESKRRIRTVGKKKISKRVAASKAYDRRRLSSCTLLATQSTGKSGEERFAWQAMPTEDEFSYLYSPRIGRFVDDYCGVLAADSVLCTFPFSRATPDMWNEISLIELTSPKRKRITVGRNEQGDAVGVLFVTEHVEDSVASDSVVSYV